MTRHERMLWTILAITEDPVSDAEALQRIRHLARETLKRQGPVANVLPSRPAPDLAGLTGLFVDQNGMVRVRGAVR
jgi:hypothetical protein